MIKFYSNKIPDLFSRNGATLQTEICYLFDKICHGFDNSRLPNFQRQMYPAKRQTL